MLADGRLRAEPLITDSLPLADAVSKGIQQYETDRDHSVKTLVEMPG